jgi:hypothetical protein
VYKKTVVSANITVLGHFNPAILRHDFLVKTCGIDLGEPKRMSPLDVPVMSEIEYHDGRWFMDFGRMVVESTDLETFSQFKGPAWVSKYMDILRHTPIYAVGMNFHTNLRFEDMGPFVSKLADLENVSSVMTQITPFVPVEITQRYMQISGQRRLTELGVSYPDRYLDMPVHHLLIVSVTEGAEAIRVNFNIETHDLDPFPDKLRRFMESFDQRSDFGEVLIQRLIGEETQ